MDDCKTVEEMEKYYEIASSFDQFFISYVDYLTPNCKTINYVVHDYSTDPSYKQLNDSNEFELTVGFLSFYRTVIYIMFLSFTLSMYHSVLIKQQPSNWYFNLFLGWNYWRIQCLWLQQFCWRFWRIPWIAPWWKYPWTYRFFWKGY